MNNSLLECILCVSVGALVTGLVIKARLGSFRQHAMSIIKAGEIEANKQRAELALQLQILKSDHEHSIQREQQELDSRERRLTTQTQQIASDSDRLKKELAKAANSAKDLEHQKAALDSAKQEALASLERISSMTLEESRTELLSLARAEAGLEFEKERSRQLRLFEVEAEHQATSLLLSAIERKTQALTKETFVTEISLPHHSLIPKLIGKDGRNIQTFQELLQVAISIEETPLKLIISSHDRKLRMIAQKTIERTIAREKITPVTIRECFDICSAECDRIEEEQGTNALKNYHETVPLTPELIKAVGALAFRSSYGQNVLAHCLEVAELMGILASEIGLHRRRAQAIGLLHDIGKGLSKEWGASHALAGKRFLEQFEVDATVINGVASHHGEEPPRSSEARLLPVCDRLSAQLPGVRETKNPAFLAMINQCERVTKDLPGIRSSWAHYGGSHIELVIHHETAQPPESIHSSVQKAIAQTNIQLPVRITLLT